MRKAHLLELDRKSQRKLEKLVEDIRNGNVEGCCGEKFANISESLAVEGLEAWVWRNYLLVYDADPQNGGKASIELSVFADAEARNPAYDLRLLEDKFQSRVGRRSKKRRQEGARQNSGQPGGRA